jgi:hypothetical protein
VSLDRELAALRTTTALAAGDHIACVNYDREFPGSAALARAPCRGASPHGAGRRPHALPAGGPIEAAGQVIGCTAMTHRRAVTGSASR